MTKLKLFFILFSIALFVGNSHICNYVHRFIATYSSEYIDTDLEAIGIIRSKDSDRSEKENAFNQLYAKYKRLKATNEEQVVLNEYILIQWWTLRLNFYAVLFAVSLIMVALYRQEKIIKFFLSIGICLCGADVVDRVYFNINSFQINDIGMIILSIGLSYYFAYVWRQSK